MKANILVISDSIGETARNVAHAALSQFDSQDVNIKRFSYVKTLDDLEIIMEEAEGGNTVLVYTLLDPHLRQELVHLAKEKEVDYVDVMGPMMGALGNILQKEPRLEPGLIHQLDEEYFRRVEAIEFTVKYDDLNDPRGVELADVVLIGVSRTSKTPMSIYLAYRGYKAANIPLVPEVEPPDVLFNNPGNKVIGLTIDPLLLNEIRQERLKALGLNLKANYASVKRINEELDYASKLMRRVACPIIDVTNKSVEESATEILRYLKNKDS